MKTATIQHATGDGTWQSAYGLMYSYELHLSNGEHIKVNAKKANAFASGQTINYELTGKTDNNQTPLAKIVSDFNQRPQGGGYSAPAAQPAQAGGKDRSILIQVAFKMAMDRINADPTKSVDEVPGLAKWLYNELKTAHEQF
jgi:hypothetical protein